ncbi:MAG TPA: hypothetical protein VK917_02445 [Ilumatobacter sp.]|nr:hypothetical protein [Ilumatobacter sp.]
MIGKLSMVRHGIVGAAIAGTTLLAGLGVIADPHAGKEERFDAKTLVIAPEGGRGVRITEYVDIDFGSAERRGYRRIIPNDLGVPTDVVAATPDAAADLTVIPHVSETEIRIGDPDRTWRGQHRYQLSYTLPDAYEPTATPPDLFLDIVAPIGVGEGDAETGRFEVIVTGFELSDTRCDVGRGGDEGGCELAGADDGTHRVVLEPLAAGDGLTIGGVIDATTEPTPIDPPPIPDRRNEPNRGLVALGFAGLGFAGAVPVYVRARRKGRNEVFAGGAADAAYGSLPPPGSESAAAPVTLVPDDEMGDLATIEFVPPKGLAPWEASVLLWERVDDETVEAWLSGLVGREALSIDESGKNLELSSGPRRQELPEPDAGLLRRILDLGDPYTTGTYDEKFASAWSAIQRSQADRIASTGWWKHLPPGTGLGIRTSGSPFGLIMIAVFALVWAGSGITALLGAFGGWWLGITIGLVFPALVAMFVYRVLLPSRSAQGSALALRTESFRRFLHASEARHVEWAWTNGLLREYSAWAVALGEADAWSRALERANVPAPARVAAGPIAVHTFGSSFSSSRTAPSSSGSGGGGFSGGGGVGGGGGGGSSGSW